MRFGRALLRWIKRPLMAWLDRVGMVLSPEWCQTALLVWGVWFFIPLGASHAIKGLSTSPKPSYQPTPRSTCIIQSCWRQGRAPTSLEGSLWEVVIFTLGGCPGSRARLTDAWTYVAWGVHGRKPARTTTFVGRDDPLDSILLHGLCARRPSVLGSRQFGGDQSERHGELRFDAFFAVLTDSRIRVDDVCGVVWVSPAFSRWVCG